MCMQLRRLTPPNFALLFSCQPASYGKKNGMWYASPGNQGWGSKALSRKASVVEAADVVSQAQAAAHSSSTIKPSAGRVIRIINSLDHSVQVSREQRTERNQQSGKNYENTCVFYML